MKVSTFILTYNRRDAVKKALDTNIENNGGKPPWDELIWVDNGSTEDLRSLAESYKPDVLILHKENLGVSKGYNRGKALCTGDWILDLGDRSMLPPGCYEAMVKVASTDELDVVCIYECDRNDHAERHIPGEDKTFAGFTCYPGIGYASNLARRSVLSTAGYYREDLGMYGWNDVEWAHRLQARNLRTYVMIDFLVTRVADDPDLVMPGHEISYRKWRDQQVEDPQKKAVLDVCSAQGYPYYNPFA